MAVDTPCAQFGHASRRDVAGTATPKTAAGQTHTHFPFGNAAPHAVAELERSGLGVKRIDACFARHCCIGADGRKVVDLCPRAIRLPRFFNLNLQRGRID